MALATEIHGYLPGTGLTRVTMARDRIESLDVISPASDWEPRLATDGIILPGLIDLQVNGFGGIDLNDPELDVDDVLTVSESLWAHGVVGFCPTTITGPLETLRHAVTTFDAARSRPGDPRAPSILGAHLEGPWISPEEGARGAHPAEFTRLGDPDELAMLATAGRVDLVTVAPEVPDATAVIAHAVERGIQVSLGHSAAAPADIRAGMHAGATLSTHLGNGVMASLPRHPNLIWEQLASDELTAMFIADLHHLDPSTLRAMVRAKGEHRVILVSDATSLSGAKPGRYRTRIGGEVELSADGRLSVAGTPYLAGSATSLDMCLANALAHGLLPAQSAVAAATSRPASIIARTGNPAPQGRLGVGARADLVLASWDEASMSIHPEATYVAGARVWAA